MNVWILCPICSIKSHSLYASPNKAWTTFPCKTWREWEGVFQTSTVLQRKHKLSPTQLCFSWIIWGKSVSRPLPCKAKSFSYLLQLVVNACGRSLFYSSVWAAVKHSGCLSKPVSIGQILSNLKEMEREFWSFTYKALKVQHSLR